MLEAPGVAAIPHCILTDPNDIVRYEGMPGCLAAPNRIAFWTNTNDLLSAGRPRHIVSAEMKSASQFALLLTTVPDLKTARALAKSALRGRLIACANIIPRVESHYWWKKRTEMTAEHLLILKTRKSQISSLEKMVIKRHPYETPELLVLKPFSGTAKYLGWLGANCG